jgi:glyoxylase-like metal-dependent hydrolase (beta-lactamase superfamily II)
VINRADKGTLMVRLTGVLFLLLIGPAVSVHAQMTSAEATPIEVNKLRPNLFLLTGGSPNTGGSATTVVFVRSTDVVVIDTKGPRPWWGNAIADEIKRLTKLPITTIINTSGAGDHVAGNIALVNTTIEIIAHERAAADMRKMTLMFTKPTGGGLPTRTFKDRLIVGTGPDRLELYYFGAGHCHGDIFVMIPALRVLLTGDAFGGTFLPALARNSGGDGVEYPNTLTKALALTRDIDTIITGHGGGLAKPRDLEVHRDFMRDFLESTRQAKKTGLTATAAATAWRLPARYVGYEAEPARILGAMEWIYRQLP